MLLTSLTPCIYPMIPITAAAVGGQSASRARGRVLALTIAYVLGLSLAYAALGLLAGLTGTLFGGISTNPWLLIAMANLLLLFALMMLDGSCASVAAGARSRHGWEWTTSWRVHDGRGVRSGRGTLRCAGDGHAAHVGGSNS